MSLRLALFCIAVLVIAWIIWDHNNKNNNRNKLKKNRYNNQLGVISKIKSYFQSYNNTDNNTDNNTKEKKENINYVIKPELDFKKEINNTRNINFKEEIITLNIKTKGDNLLDGIKLLQALLSVGCRFGEMNIFHRYESQNGGGNVLFSIASMVKPGIFNIDAMQDLKTPGITIFFATQYGKDNSAIFDLMLKTAYSLSKYLDAEILDQHRNSLTTEKVIEIKEHLDSESELEVY